MHYLYKFFLALLASLIIVPSFAQVNTLEPLQKKKIVKPYDSTRSFLEDDAYQYVGQELYVIGKHENLRSYGYRNFYTNYEARFKSHDPEAYVYKCCESYASKYADLEERYFKVHDVLQHPKAGQDKIYSKKYLLKLTERESGDTVYYEYDSEFRHDFPFLVVGQMEKLKQRFAGKKYIFQDLAFYAKGYAYDPYTGDTIKHKVSDIWTVTDVVIEKKFYNLTFVFRNQNGQHYTDPVDNALGEDGEMGRACFSVAEANRLKAKYGEANWNAILHREVKLGMSKEMCKLAWGEPEKVNRTTMRGSQTEQWVFSGDYLYFSGNKLIAIQ